MALSWTEPSPDLELQLDGVRRVHPLPLSTLEVLDAQQAEQREKFTERYHEALTAVVKDEWMQKALELHSEIESEEQQWRDRASIRDAVGAYLIDTVFPWACKDRGFDAAKEYLLHGQALEDARKFGLWGVDPHTEKKALMWTGRAGLVKLCPDDARNEGQRVATIYGERLKLCDEGGYVLRYGVFTLPNFPRHHLASGIAEIKRRFREQITHALKKPVIERTRGGKKRVRTVARNMRDPDRLFPDLVGALCCIEAPLSGRYAEDPQNTWNVHLNVILVFKQSSLDFGMPDYAPICAAWGTEAAPDFRVIPQGSADATAAALRECIKYPLQAVAEKSGRRKVRKDRHGNILTPAPPMIAWPPELFDEWYRAFKGCRRAWSCGLLYSRKMRFSDDLVIELAKPERRDADRIDYMGTVRLSPTEFTVSPPRRDFREMERQKRARAFEHRARLSVDPAYAAAYAAKTAKATLRREHLRRRNEAERALFTLILGNKCAVAGSATTNEGFRARAGPS